MKPITILYTLAALLCSPLVAISQPARQASEVISATHKISIDEGVVYVNGKRVAEDELPESLRMLGSEVSMTFWTSENAIIEINGESVIFNDGTFNTADPTEKTRRDMRMAMRTGQGNAELRLFETPRPARGYVVRGYNADAQTMDRYAAQLREQAEQFNNLTFELKELTPESSEVMRQLVVEAENTARLASIFPHVEYEAYLGSVQDRNRGLYQGLMREHEMEIRTYQLAEAIQMAATDDARRGYERELHTILTDIFELKQANRREEIQQLERQLEELQSRLEEREDLKEDIIESRLRDLTSQSRW